MKPYLEVLADGRPVNGLFYSALKSATIRDEAGQESDSFEVEFDDTAATIALPREGTILSPSGGFRGRAVTRFGDFKVAGYERGRTASEGRYIRMTARPADLREDLKEPVSEHWDDQTLGGVLSELAERHGLVLAIDQELGSIKIPYLARVEQSAIDLVTRLADRYGATAKPAGGRLVFVKRGGTTASGQRLAPIVVRETDCSEWRIEAKPRPQFGGVRAGWLDREKGLRMEERADSGEGPFSMLRPLFATKEEAQAAAQSKLTALTRATGSGSLTLSVGRPAARAEADLKLIGFGDGASGKWRATSVSHLFGGDGYQNSIDFEAAEEGRPKPGAGGGSDDNGAQAGGSDGGFADGFTGEEYL
ncbi:phage late control D family protein [Kaistia sp. MMO-174]|uniref:phage late control D family protein n=1 Tax=Kaistia sp. MMO-174 TaxID=3081256 RepID=UPI003015D6F8